MSASGRSRLGRHSEPGGGAGLSLFWRWDDAAVKPRVVRAWLSTGTGRQYLPSPMTAVERPGDVRNHPCPRRRAHQGALRPPLPG